MDDLDAVLVLPQEGHRVLLGGVHPVGVHLQQHLGAGDQLLLGDDPVLVGLELVGVVVVVQADALFLQTGKQGVDPVHHPVHILLGLQRLEGDDDVLAANGLVVGDDILQNLVGQAPQAGVGAGGGEPVLVKPALDLLGGMVEEPGELHRGVAHFGHGLQGALHVLLGDVSHAEQLQSVLHS